MPSSSKAISSISAIPTPSVSPPCTWPSMIIGLMRVPQSSTAMKRRTLTTAGPRVDVDDADVRAEREGEVRRVVDDLGVEAGLDALGQLDRPCAASAISWIVAPFSGSPFTNQRPFSHSRSSGATSSIAEATIARPVAHLAGDERRAAPLTGVERDP